MTRRLVTILLGSATYGFAAGSVHSWRLAACNVLKFPLLILLTARPRASERPDWAVH